MVSKDIKNKFIVVISSSIILIGGIFSASYLSITNKVQHKKTYKYVLRNFDVDGASNYAEMYDALNLKLMLFIYKCP